LAAKLYFGRGGAAQAWDRRHSFVSKCFAKSNSGGLGQGSAPQFSRRRFAVRTRMAFSAGVMPPRPLGFLRACTAVSLVLGALVPLAAAAPIVFSEYDLPNGLHVILAPEHSTPVISSYVLYHVGSKNERPDRTGFAHFFEHLMFEGSENIPRGQIMQLVSRAGGNANASTSYDVTDFQINLPANQLGLAIWIESERMLHGKVEQAGVNTQRFVVKEERRVRYDNKPFGSLQEELSKLMFAGTPYAWVPIGSVQYIDQATLAEFRAFYKTYYLPNNATLVLAGDFDPDATKQMIADYFGGIPRGPEPPRPEIKLPVQTSPQTVEVVRANTPLPASVHAWHATPETDPDAYAVEMLTNILASGRSSRLYRRLVIQEQAAVEASAFPEQLEDAGAVAVLAVGNQGVTMAKLDQLIDEEVAAVKKDGVTEEELQKARNQKEEEIASSYGTMLSRAKGLAHYHVFFHDTGLVNTELASYLKVTRDDIKRVANKYLTDPGTNILHYPVPKPETPPPAAPSAPAPGA
jgi:zinc protease